ncbi:MAG: hypothetical protein JSS84_02245 [Bacteroidetes bacterium]|nr:hypothetical protein [Bacteroidota bacterium]
MRTLLLTLALATGLSTMAQQKGQTEKTPAEKAKNRTEWMTKELGLDATQQEKVAAINLQYAQAMQNVDAIKDETSRKGRASALKTSRDNNLQSVLTPQQYDKMIKVREERKAKKSAAKAAKGRK